ncbi:MAG: hypothetical protein IID37_14565 [Planctomycetes bacterium]|nr:hypothetical protein [Planctomycetota bacterium]
MASISHPSHSSHYARRGAAIYAMVLLLAFSVVGAGLTLVTVQASERRILQNIASAEQADILARAGAEWLMRTVEEDANWRSTLTNGVALAATPATGLSFSVSLTDTDGSLSDDDTDQVTLTATGMYQGATHAMSLTASPNAHHALTYAVVAYDDAAFQGGTTISGPVYAADWIFRYSGDPTISAGAYFESPTGGHIESVFVPADDQVPAMTAPTPDLDFYISQATTISLSSKSHLRGENLTPTDNTQGTANAQGIYYLHIGTKDVHSECSS